MAITEDTLNQLNGRAYGPVTFRSAGAAHAATLDGRPAELAIDGPTVRVRTTVAVPWPREGDPADVARRVAAALALAGAVRPDLVTLSADAASSSALVSLWIDAERSTIADLATAVRTCVLLGDVAWRAVDQVAMAMATEQQVLRDAAASQARLEQAEQALARIAPLPEAAGPAPTVSPPPPFEPQPAAPPAPAPAQAPSRYCAACGSPNAAGYRFCVACGKPLQ